MAPEKLDSPDADSLKPLVQQLLTRIDDLLAQNKALLARVAVLEAKLGQPPKTPDNSSLPPSRGHKANAEPPATRPPRKGRPGVARQLTENPDATRRFYTERCRCGAVLDAAGQDLAKEYDHIDIPPIRAGDDAHRGVPRHVPVLQGTRDGKGAHRYARRHAVRPGHHVDRHLLSSTSRLAICA
jgi:transposase